MIGRAIAFVRARVARRLFVLFVISAFLPLTALALLSLEQVRALLLQQGDRQLAAIAKSYGMTLFERLLLAADVGVSTANSPQGVLARDSLAPRTFRSLVVVDRNGRAQPVLGQLEVPLLGEDLRARLERRQLVVLVTGEAEPRVLIAAPLPAANAGFALGELQPAFLWGPVEDLPTATEFCVVEERSMRRMHCTHAEGVAAVRAVRPEGATIASVMWERGEEAMLSRVWPQFMGAAFGTADWVVVASQPQKVQLRHVREFTSLYVPVVLITLLLVLLLTLRQSRDIVGPMAKLVERTRGIAANHFGERLDLKRDDEFGELSTAVDQMSQRLGRQFASLTVLAEIDHLILSTQDTAQIVRTVLKRLGEVVQADLLSLTLFDNEDPDGAQTFFTSQDMAGNFAMNRHRAAAADREAIERDPCARWLPVPTEGALPAYLELARQHGMTSAFVQPIVWPGAVCGAMIMGYRGEAVADEEERQRARELADRVAVAISSAWREEQLYQQAHFDPLTGAPNRHLFRDRLDQEIIRSRREGLVFALLFVDLDHFKHVNDSFGHSTGDIVLREAATRISGCIRASDTVSRLGGDEFTVLLTNLDNPQEAWLIAETMVGALSREFTLGEQQVFLSASVGIASYPADGHTPEELLKAADTAMYRAKAGGRAQAVFFEERMNEEAVARLTLDRDLRAAIDRGELTLHYQPQLDLASGEIRSAEALVRWKHPVRGMVPPATFIPLAEESGFIETLGQWIIETACRQIRAWGDSGLAIEYVSVNVSPRQFRKRTLVQFIDRCTREAGVKPSSLHLEITEGLLLEQGEAVEGMLREMAARGHSIALDDFGTGFSSMAYLKRLPVHMIKIDRVFIEGLERSPDSEAIVAAIVAMSHALGKRVIAEGVEKPEQLTLLRRLRCDGVQGFVLAPALSALDFEALLRARHGEALTA